MPLLAIYALTVLEAYLLGAIPTGYLVARSNRNVDLLRLGSGRTGTTNVLRTMGWKAAAVVFLGDFGKGVLAVLVARVLSGGDPVVETVAALAAIFGHTFSIYIGFKGGRGVATGVGGLAAIAPLAALVAAAIAFTTIGISRYVSLGSILGACSAPVTVAVLVFAAGESPVRLIYAFLGALFVVVSHKDNIGRLLKGTERKLGEHVRA